MNLYLKQEPLSFRTRFSVFDESEAVIFEAEGEFSFFTKLHVYDPNDQEVAYIEQQVFTLLPRYQIEIPGWPPAVLTKHFTLFKSVFSLDAWGWQAEGDFFAHEYTLSDDTHTLMTVSKAWFSWGDSYQLSIADDANPLACVCALLAMDMAIAQSERN